MLKSLMAKVSLVGLTPLQIGIVGVIFFFTLFGAIGAAVLMRRWNDRNKTRVVLAKLKH